MTKEPLLDTMGAVPLKRERVGIVSVVRYELLDADGNVLRSGKTKNLVTAVGDQMYASRGVGLTSSSLPNGMKLGTDSSNTTPSKTGTGSAILTYLSGSNVTWDAGFPTVVGGVVTYQCTWPAGTATTALAITEAAIVTDSGANANSASAATIARVLIANVPSKGASEILRIAWTHTVAGT